MGDRELGGFLFWDEKNFRRGMRFFWAKVPSVEAAALRALLVLCVLLMGIATGGAQPAEHRIALVIGEANYVHVPELENTPNDARLVAATLKGLGFNLVDGAALLNLNRTQFVQAVRTFGSQLSDATVAVFYYAGHGVQLQGTNYLVPIDANPTRAADADFELIDVNAILRQMDGGTRLNIVILDACRNNPFGGRGLRDVSPGLAQINAPRGTLIAYATQPGNVAQDGPPGTDGPYALALTKSMKESGRDVFQIFNDVGNDVDRATQGAQQPWLSSSPIDGDFYFAGKPRPPAPAVITDNEDQARAKTIETVFWNAVKTSNDPESVRGYLQVFPNGMFALQAQERLTALASAGASSSNKSAPSEVPDQSAPLKLSALGMTGNKATAPAGPVPKDSAIIPPPPHSRNFDGTWQLEMSCLPSRSDAPVKTGYTGSRTLLVRGNRISGSAITHIATILTQAGKSRPGLKITMNYEGTVKDDGTVVINGHTSDPDGGVEHYEGVIDDTGVLSAKGTDGFALCTLSGRIANRN